MTRQEILAQYLVENGIITSPGKFEREPIYAPYFYELWLDNGADNEPIAVEDEDRREFPELEDIAEVRVSEDDDGFVYLTEERESGAAQ